MRGAVLLEGDGFRLPLATLLIVAWPPGSEAMQAPPGTMDRSQAIVVGAGVLLIVGVIVVLASLGGR